VPSLLNVLILSIFIVATAIAWRGGAAPERAVATTIMVWIGVDMIYHLLYGRSSFDTVDPFHVVIDTAELMVIFWLALRANRLWPLFAAAAQVMCVTGHISVLVQHDGMRRAYWAMTQLPQYIQLTALIMGVAAHERRERVVGRYRSWRYS
jgi:hypothetical protein